ncbi:MAG: hypothetical protein GY751_25885 [Bacteroidetes bacterium]|nr:hypothetical protein [Bacteroidota bacterium]
MDYRMKLLTFLLLAALSLVSYAETLKYAAGLTVNHRVNSDSLRYLDMTRPIEVIVQMKVESDSGMRWQLNDPYVEVEKVTPLRDGESGIKVRLRLHKDGWENGKKKLLISGYFKDEERQLTFSSEEFRVVPLKTIIIAVDGLAYQSISQILQMNEAPNFSKVFAQAINKDEAALSALPSITFTNWPGVFGGRPPRDHGILGNSFFEREKARGIRGLPSAEPFASTGSFNPIENLSVVRGELNERVRIEASIYDRIAMVTGKTINAWSVHGFYSLTNRPHVNMSAIHYGGSLLGPFDLKYKGHSPNVARTLDTTSGEEAENILRDHIDELDMLTVYFPGPDNVAHDVGAKKNKSGFTAGHALPEVNKPLVAIGEQVTKVTDHELGRIVNIIEQQGYLNATLFVLVADHGLHAYRNDRLHNIYLPEQRNSDPFLESEDRRKERAGLVNFFRQMGLKVWQGSHIDTQSIVYSPNGGMAHIYIRNTTQRDGDFINPWNKPARKTDIEMVARQLYVEAVGGRGYIRCPDPQVDMLDTSCYAKLTKLQGALGTPPAIFVRVGEHETDNHFTHNFRWVKNVQPGIPARIEYADIDEFIRASHANWPEFNSRLDEMNDKNPNGSRTGDIVIFTNGRAGYLTINESDGLNGWHGGATISESQVPLMFDIPGSSIDDEFKNSIILGAVDEVKNTRSSRTLRNWDLREILGGIYSRLQVFDLSGMALPLAPTNLQVE